MQISDMQCYWLVCLYSVLSIANCLECGLSATQNQDDLKRSTSICMLKVVRTDLAMENTSLEQDYDASDEDNSGSSIEESAGNRKFDSALPNKDQISNSGDIQNNTEITNNCVVHCVLKRLGLLDVDDYPDHGKISENLVKGADNRELKDFLQDSTDECFQSIERGENNDHCYFSAQLIKCLAEKGRSNCSDWPMSNDLPFTQIF